MPVYRIKYLKQKVVFISALIALDTTFYFRNKRKGKNTKIKNAIKASYEIINFH